MLSFWLLFSTRIEVNLMHLRLQEPVIRPIEVFDSSSWPDILPDIPLWVKNSDYERVSSKL